MKREKILDQLGKPCAHESLNDPYRSGMSTFQRVEHFQLKMGLQYNHLPVTPTVSERLLRGRLMLEEFMEFIEDGLGLRFSINGADLRDNVESFEVYHREGDKYCPVETLDGICDMKVIADGTGASFGLPVDQADWEVYCSNMSKLDENGKPVVNRCVNPEHEHAGRMHKLGGDCELLDDSKPVGKLLKPDTYVPANLARLIVEAQPDNIASSTLTWLLEHGEVE